MAWWWVAAAWAFPSPTFTPDQLWTRLPVQLGSDHQNQPMAVNGLLVAGGNGVHPVWDLENLAAPRLVATLTSPHHDGEAESHQLSARVGPDGEVWVVTISGLGVDLWDLTTPEAPALLASVELEGVRYGDNTEAVWGVAWQGDVLYVGGTSTGLHVIDTTDPAAPVVVGRLPTSALGGVSAGPLWAVGDLLVTPNPKPQTPNPKPHK
jgi:WD40 repeat protein